MTWHCRTGHGPEPRRDSARRKSLRAVSSCSGSSTSAEKISCHRAETPLHLDPKKIQGRSNRCFIFCPLFHNVLSFVLPSFCRCWFHTVPSSNMAKMWLNVFPGCQHVAPAPQPVEAHPPPALVASASPGPLKPHPALRSAGHSAQMRQVGAFFKNAFRA